MYNIKTSDFRFFFFSHFSFLFLENASCSTLRCPSQKQCLLDVKTGTPTCSDCTKSCPSSFHIPVCGTDGRTYSSYCHMRVVSCRKGVLIKARRAGECKGTPFEPPHDKTNKNGMCAQRRLGSAWASAQSVSAWKKLGSLATHWAHNEDSDQTGRMPRLIWVFAGRTVSLLLLSWGGSFYINKTT